ncbi:hypothetical protein Tsubulata_020720, partial [Turnera subulata]
STTPFAASSNSFNKSPVTLTGSSTLPPSPSSASPTSVRGELFGDDPLGGRGVAADVEVELDVFFFWEKVTNRLKTLKEQMALAVDLLYNKSGFGWNDNTKRFEASSEVWNTLIQAKPKFRIVRGKSLDHLELLRDIYEKDRATGGGSGTAKEKVKQWEREKRTTSASKSSSSSSKKKPRLNDELSEEIKEVSSAMKQVANAILTTNRRVWTEEEMFEAMGKLGLKGMALCDAVDWLVVHPNLIGTFFACPEELRSEWLMRKMGH